LVVITIDRPQTRNSQTPDTWDALVHIGDVLPSQTRIVVVRGQGSTFSSGLDRAAFDADDGGQSLMSLAALSPGELDERIASFQRGFAWLHDNADIISLAAVDGAAVGAGFQLALACDFRIATSAARFSMREPALGLVPDLTGTHPLVRLIGYSRALELCATTRWIEADEAQLWGLVNVVDDELDSAVESLVEHLLSIPTQALRETKGLLLSAQELTATDQRADERAAQSRLLRQGFRTQGR
jgi:enoyl-CoA hydratase/carnithine racemase